MGLSEGLEHEFSVDALEPEDIRSAMERYLHARNLNVTGDVLIVWQSVLRPKGWSKYAARTSRYFKITTVVPEHGEDAGRMPEFYVGIHEHPDSAKIVVRFVRSGLNMALEQDIEAQDKDEFSIKFATFIHHALRAGMAKGRTMAAISSQPRIEGVELPKVS